MNTQETKTHIDDFDETIHTIDKDAVKAVLVEAGIVYDDGEVAHHRRPVADEALMRRLVALGCITESNRWMEAPHITAPFDDDRVALTVHESTIRALQDDGAIRESRTDDLRYIWSSPSLYPADECILRNGRKALASIAEARSYANGLAVMMQGQVDKSAGGAVGYLKLRETVGYLQHDQMVKWVNDAMDDLDAERDEWTRAMDIAMASRTRAGVVA